MPAAPVRFIYIYLVGYFVLLIAALVALWTGGVLQQIPAGWLVPGVLVAFGLGIILAVTARRPAVPSE
ncbi:hypothetical protein BH23ACI1_BH23ACI1_16780 [soil metagenome]|nr:hypothetical protein [Acidobacteriota bacterium]